MHYRNFYRDNPPDFKVLASEFPSFAKFVKGNKKQGTASIDFRNPDAQRELTLSLLRRDFHISIDLPANRLVPTVPSRLDYICWIEDLLQSGGQQGVSVTRGIDVGCGASAIYALLGAKLHGWHFIASEVNKASHSVAQANVVTNDMAGMIKVKLVSGKSILREAVEDETERFSFSMCNPPFFGNVAEVLSTQEQIEGRPRPGTVTSACLSESVTTGGEVAFVKQMVDESQQLFDRVVWYTTLLGKKSSIKEVKTYIKTVSPCAVVDTVFRQGRTSRWAIAWSFCQMSCHIEHVLHQKGRMQESYRMLISRRVPAGGTGEHGGVSVLGDVAQHAQSLLEKAQVRCCLDAELMPGGITVVGKAVHNTWSHWRRRKRQIQRNSTQDMVEPSPPHGQDNEASSVLHFKLTLEEDKSNVGLNNEVANNNSVVALATCLHGDRGNLHQLLVHLKNQFEAQPGFQCSSPVSLNKRMRTVPLHK